MAKKRTTPTTVKPTRKRTPKSTAVAVVSQPVEIVVENAPLPDKWELFVDQYFICNLNGTEAAMITFNCSTRESAASVASEYLRKPEIAARIEERLAEFHLSANEVLARLSMMARGSMEEFIDPDSGVIDLKKAKQAKKLGLIKKYRTKFTTTTRTDNDGNAEDVETTEIEIELYDAQAALVHVGKHLNLFAADTNLNINLSLLSDEQLRSLASGKKYNDVEMPK